VTSTQDALDLIGRGTEELLKREELEARLKLGRPLRIKAGFDPTAPDLHLGHTVLLNKMRQFQDLGHQVIFLIGDFTGMIGDPTGKNVTRKPLTREDVAGQRQDLRRPGVQGAGSRAHRSPLQQRMVRPDVGRRHDQARRAAHRGAHARTRRLRQALQAAQQSIAIHEFLYPLVQGYDSVALKADVELGGTDQKFNLLMGRGLQEHFGQPPQIVLTMPLLEGLDGVNKMSKSLGNYIGINEPAIDIVTKTMKIGDDLMWRWIDLLSFEIGMPEVAQLRHDIEGGQLNPRDLKLRLARELAARFHDAAAAEQAIAGWHAAVRGEGDTAAFRLPRCRCPRKACASPAALDCGRPHPEQLRSQPQAQGAGGADRRRSARRRATCFHCRLRGSARSRKAQLRASASGGG
jgi:tyrosyl-tRNA synthetase